MPRILAFSSSRAGNGGYFETVAPMIKEFLHDETLTIGFVPFASVVIDYERYTRLVRQALPAFKNIITVTQQHPEETIDHADVIMVGGGNTFKLLHDLNAVDLLELIRKKVNSGSPYIGWSAGANITGATIGTTNDMPIINPGGFNALGFFPFQLNPHYYQIQLPGFNGETRDQRLEEFVRLNTSLPVVALPEGTALLLDNNKLQLTGGQDAFVFTWQNNAMSKKTITAQDDLSWLMQA